MVSFQLQIYLSKINYKIFSNTKLNFYFYSMQFDTSMTVQLSNVNYSLLNHVYLHDNYQYQNFEV